MNSPVVILSLAEQLQQSRKQAYKEDMMMMMIWLLVIDEIMSAMVIDPAKMVDVEGFGRQPQVPNFTNGGWRNLTMGDATEESCCEGGRVMRLKKVIAMGGLSQMATAAEGASTTDFTSKELLLHMVVFICQCW